ncbi:hypothetical protein SeMB42_g04213 [Synchytrium endobioticum]|uniref:GPI ethanolamine phosphate transferase 2 C-terminal domain-containing protein n=1 Tax=Synchytrium endobioticum TaxID=286115 RepID=A0A507CJ16_9FUNG|nr:hypothetical protein SeLEV6574_g07201 [Synchytrium endobioticum]TPX44757.1 hypothetical protein SeMB42_g04213 [Synchytrium endobioticum]
MMHRLKRRDQLLLAITRTPTLEHPATATATASSSSSASASGSYVTLRTINFPASQLRRLGCLVTVILLLHAASLYIFASGFLLTRVELDLHNNCSTLHPLLSPTSRKAHAFCWTAPRYERAVILIIDALRHDFVVWDPRHGPVNESRSTTQVPYYINRLPAIHTTITTQPHHGRIYRFVADPPTTTLQRLKALTTGTLPTFVDAGSNFGGSGVTEDNILSQLTSKGKRIDFVGDDTWQGLYGHVLNTSHPYPSLDVWDLHTVDNGCIQHLFPSLAYRNASNANQTGWDVYIAHFLGVDHAGHRYGPHHVAMSDKLTQMNHVLERVMALLDDDTLLIVMGDHGMDPKGDHGGESDLEISAALFVYSKSKPLYDPLHDHDFERLTQVRKEVRGEFDHPFAAEYTSIAQVDLVPTLSLLLGIPIPFGNLGSVIPELLLSGDDPLLNVVNGMRLNAWQIHHYVHAYSQTRAGASLPVGELEKLFESAEAMYADVMATSDRKNSLQGQQITKWFKDPQKSMSTESPRPKADADQLMPVYQKYLRYTSSILFAAKQIWARFDIPMIVMGLALLGMTVMCTALYAWVGAGHEDSVPFMWMGIGSVLGCGIGVSRVVKHAIGTQGDSAMTIYHQIIFMASIGCLLPLLVWVLRRLSRQSLHLQWPSIAGLALSSLYVVSLGSDSYTVWEDSVTLYLTQTGWLLSLAAALTIRHNRLIAISTSCLILTRLVAASTVCRDEQVPQCTSTFYANPGSSVSPLATTLGLPVMAYAVPYTLKRAADATGGAYGTAGRIISSILPPTMLAAAAYWLLDYADQQSHAVASTAAMLGGSTVKTWWARLLFPSLALALVYLWSTDATSADVDVDEDRNLNTPYSRLPKLRGAPNTVGNSILALLGLTGAVTAFVLKPTGAVVLGVTTVQLVAVAETCALWPDVDPFFFVVLLWGHVHHAFFATGHQNTFAAIDWSAAFIGVEAAHTALAGMLVGLNTFGAPVLGAVGCVLVATWRRTLVRGTERGLVKRISACVVGWIALEGALVFGSAAFAGLHRRHLMVWRVWAPRFVFAAMWLLVVDIAALVCGVLAVYRASRAWESFLKKLKHAGLMES